MSAFLIAVPEAASLPETTAKLINALRGLVVTLHRIEEGDLDCEIAAAWVGAATGEVLIKYYPWVDGFADYTVGRITRLSVLSNITVH